MGERCRCGEGPVSVDLALRLIVRQRRTDRLSKAWRSDTRFVVQFGLPFTCGRFASWFSLHTYSISSSSASSV